MPIAMWTQVLNTAGVDPLEARDMRALTIKGRLLPTVALGEAQAELSAIAGDLERLHPDTNDARHFVAQTEFQWRVWAGLGLGLLLSIVTARMLPSFVPFSEAYDARSMFGLVPVLFAVTLLAAFVPARRAAGIKPADALRHE